MCVFVFKLFNGIFFKFSAYTNTQRFKNMILRNYLRRTFYCCNIIVIIFGIQYLQQLTNAAKLSSKYYPSGVDFFEHEFPSLAEGV